MSGLLERLFGHFSLDGGWVFIGLAGQAMFTARFFVQWLASERKKESVMPVAFWYFSILGGTVSLVYAVAIGSLPFSLGQATGLFIYLRNLQLIRRKAAAQIQPLID
jgi:lipid-A-disaccharide synthase-like uncharacterized protein